jgi:hypothetical protein
MLGSSKHTIQGADKVPGQRRDSRVQDIEYAVNLQCYCTKECSITPAAEVAVANSIFLMKVI